MVIPLLLSSLFCKRPSQDEVRIFINSIGLLPILLSSYNRLAALGLVLSLIAISYPRNRRHNSKKKEVIQKIKLSDRWEEREMFRSIFPSKIIPSWLLRSWEGKDIIIFHPKDVWQFEIFTGTVWSRRLMSGGLCLIWRILITLPTSSTVQRTTSPRRR